MISVFNYFCLLIINNFKALKIKEIWVTLQVSAAIAQQLTSALASYLSLLTHRDANNLKLTTSNL